MKKQLFAIALLVAISFGVSYAQTTTVSATVVDSDSTAWANGTWSINFKPGPGFNSPKQYSINGAALSAGVYSQSGSMNGSGVFSVTVYDSTIVTPGGSGWTLTVCPNASVACSTYQFSTAGATQDISSTLTSKITAPRFQAPGAYGYNDTEYQQSLIPGALYWNVTSNTQRCYNGSAWANCGGIGTITNVTAGSCMTGGGSTGSVTLNAGSPVNAQTATYQVVAADFSQCKTIGIASGNFTVTLVASGTQPTNGQFIRVVNYGQGNILVAPSGQNINGASANISLGSGASATITSDGTNYIANVGTPAIATGWPTAPLFQYDFWHQTDGSTTIIDSGPNGYNGSCGIGHCPRINHTGPGFNSAPTLTNDVWFTAVNGSNPVTAGMQTAIICYEPFRSNIVDANGVQALLSDQSNNALTLINSHNTGFTNMSTNVATNIGNEPTDPVGQYICQGTNFTSGGFSYPYGFLTNQINRGGSVTWATTGGASVFGHFANTGVVGSSFNGNVYIWVGFAAAYNATQMSQAIAYAESLIAKNGGPSAFVKPVPNNPITYVGDSRMCGFMPNLQCPMYTSRPYYIGKLNPALANFQNYAIPGILLSTINQGGVGYNPQLSVNTAQPQTVIIDAGINDIHGGPPACTSAANCYTLIQTTGTTFTTNPNVTAIYETPLAANFLNATQEGYREGAIASIISGATATPKTFTWTIMSDIAELPIAETFTAPSTPLPSGAPSLTNSSCVGNGTTTTCTATTAIPLGFCRTNSVFLLAGVNATINGNQTAATCSGSAFTFPSTFNSTSSTGTFQWQFMGDYSWDGVHELGLLNQQLAPLTNLEYTIASGYSGCQVIPIVIPYWSVDIFNQASPATTQNVPLITLQAGQQVCSLSFDVETAFAGPTTPTVTIGDSSGSSTSYYGSPTPLALGSTGVTNGSPAFHSSNGQVYAAFSNVSGNANTFSNGNLIISIGVQARP